MRELILLALSVPILTGLLSLSRKNGKVLRLINLLGSSITTAVLLAVIYRITNEKVYAGDIFYLDQLSAVMLFVVALLTFTAGLFSLSYMEKEVKEGNVAESTLPRYYALLNLFTFAMISVLVVGNLGLMWVAVEGTTLASAMLVAFYFNREALEAAWKYVMICTVGICLALLGTMILYYAQITAGGAENALNWISLKELADKLDPAVVKTAFIFILIGYGTKAGLAPMHTWLPDAHSQAPSPVSALLSGALLSCALYALMRNMIIVKGVIGPQYPQYLLMGIGMLSVITAIPFILAQHDVKRLLAYSSVEHMGLIVLGLGVGTPLAIYAALLHIVNHAVAKSSVFYLAGLITQEYKTKNIKEIRGVINVMPVVATLFVVGILAITGSPPFNIFISKFMIIMALFENQKLIIGGVTLILLTCIFAGMMRYSLKIGFGPVPEGREKAAVAFPAMVAVVMSLAVIIGGGVYLPPVFNSVLIQAVEIVVGG